MQQVLLKINLLNQVCFYVFLIFLTCIVLYYAFNTLPSFDGAMNLQVAVNLMKNFQYAGNYPEYNLFPSEIQTGIPVLLPIAVLFSIFGVSSELALLVNAFYLFILFFIFFKIAKCLKINKFFVALFCFCILSVPNFQDLAFGVYGEMPTFAYIALAVYLLIQFDIKKNKYYLFLAGLSYGLAYLTKTVALIAFPSIFVVFLSRIIIEKKSVKSLIYFCLSFLFPIVIYEVFRLSQLGFHSYYKLTVIQFIEVLAQAGTPMNVSQGFYDTINIFEKITLHLNFFSEYYHINVFFVLIAFSFLFIFFVISLFKNKKVNFIDIFVILAFSYFIWWLAITPTGKAWQRRIFIGTFCLEWSLIYYCQNYLKKIRASKVLCGILTIFVYCYMFFSLYHGSCFSTERKEAYNLFAKKINSLSDKEHALFCGVDWWQAPVLSFLTCNTFCDLNLFSNTSKVNLPVYFISSERSFGGEDQHMLPFATKLISKNEDYNLQLYKVNIHKWYNKFSQNEILNVQEKVLLPNNVHQYSRRIFEYTDDIKGRWMQKKAALLLKKDKNVKEYVLSYYVPENINRRKKYNFVVQVGDHIVVKINDVTSGKKTIRIAVPEEYYMKDYIDFYFRSNISVLKSNTRDRRQLSTILYKLIPVS